MSQKKTKKKPKITSCKNCSWAYRDDLDDLYCTNPDGFWATEPVDNHYVCDEWEEMNE